MKLDDSAQKAAQRLGEALVEGAKRDAERLQTAAQEATEGLLERARHVQALNNSGEGTLLGTARAVFAKEFTARDEGFKGGDGQRLGWPLALLELRFGNNHVVQLCDDRDISHDLPPGRYRALVIFTRLD